MSLDFLYGSAELMPFDLEEIEKRVVGLDTLECQMASRLLVEVRRLKLEANKLLLEIDDPAYQYASGRIHRHAIVCRNAEIDSLRKEISALQEPKEIVTV